MIMFNHTYDTTACGAYSMRDIKSALIKAKINGELENSVTSEGRRLKGIFYVTPYSKAIGPFYHPVEIELTNGSRAIVVDQRPNLSVQRTGETKISQSTHHTFLTLRGMLEYLWAHDGADSLQFLGQIPFRVYARWLSESIVRRLGLPPEEQQRISALAGYYYQCLYQPFSDLKGDQKLQMAVKIRNYVGIPTEVTLPLIDPLVILNGIDEFCEAVREMIPNPRLNNLNPAFLISICSGVWFGPAAKEVAAAALEYPPAFIAMVYTALNDRTMHGAQFTKLVESVSKPQQATDFNTGMRHCLETLYDV